MAAISGSALIIDDHPLYLDALERLLAAQLSALSVVAASSAEEGLRRAARVPDLRIILVDPGLPGISGTEAVTAYRNAFPGVAIVAVSASEERRDAAAALRAGAKAFVSKAVSPEILIDVLKRVLADQIKTPEWLTPRGAGVLDYEQQSLLTQRQQEVLGLIAQGHSNKEIGLRLHLSEATVKMHVSSIFRALNVASRTQSVRAARRLGLCSFEAEA